MAVPRAPGLEARLPGCPAAPRCSGSLRRQRPPAGSSGSATDSRLRASCSPPPSPRVPGRHSPPSRMERLPLSAQRVCTFQTIVDAGSRGPGDRLPSQLPSVSRREGLGVGLYPRVHRERTRASFRHSDGEPGRGGKPRGAGRTHRFRLNWSQLALPDAHRLIGNAGEARSPLQAKPAPGRPSPGRWGGRGRGRPPTEGAQPQARACVCRLGVQLQTSIFTPYDEQIKKEMSLNLGQGFIQL